MASIPALAAYLRAEAGRPFAYGESDCVTLVAGWIASRRGGDPLQAFRDYASRDPNSRVQGEELLTLAVAGAERAGLSLTDDPQPGDVAIVRAAFLAPVCALMTDAGRWAVRAERGGLVTLPAARVTVLAAWKV